MLLTGTYPRTLDDKKRLTFPKRVRELLGEPEVLFVTPGPTDAEARVFRRLYFAQTEQVDVDRTGRVLIPDRLIQFASLGHDVVLIGVRDHLELWDAARWQQYLGQHAPRFDAVAEGAFK